MSVRGALTGLDETVRRHVGRFLEPETRAAMPRDWPRFTMALQSALPSSCGG